MARALDVHRDRHRARRDHPGARWPASPARWSPPWRPPRCGARQVGALGPKSGSTERPGRHHFAGAASLPPGGRAGLAARDALQPPARLRAVDRDRTARRDARRRVAVVARRLAAVCSRTYGNRYKHGIEQTGLDYQTLRNYAMVARRFELSRRRHTLSFHHHAELCALSREEQDRWLDLAEAGRWSRNELRRRLRAERQPETTSTSPRLDVKVDLERQARWREAATRSGRDLTSWIVETLDEAASTVLSPPSSS